MALVRVRTANGMETSVGEAWAKAEGLEILDEPATRPDRSPREQTRAKGRKRKPKTSVSEEAAKKKTSGGKAASAEEAPE